MSPTRAARGRVHLPLRPQHRVRVDVNQVAERRGQDARRGARRGQPVTCSDTNQQHIKDMIREHKFEPPGGGSCSPRTHEILFQETLRDSALNPYLFAMTNIRDQCSWVHRDESVAARKRQSISCAWPWAVPGASRHWKPAAAVTQDSAGSGGGLAGMTAALGLAEPGLRRSLDEKRRSGRPVAQDPLHARAFGCGRLLD